jgi:hypothetical protein
MVFLNMQLESVSHMMIKECVWSNAGWEWHLLWVHWHSESHLNKNNKNVFFIFIEALFKLPKCLKANYRKLPLRKWKALKKKEKEYFFLNDNEIFWEFTTITYPNLCYYTQWTLAVQALPSLYLTHPNH